MGYGAQAASNSPYGAAFSQTAAAFAQGSTALQSGQKRDSPYDQASTTSPWYMMCCIKRQAVQIAQGHCAYGVAIVFACKLTSIWTVNCGLAIQL